MGLITVFFKWLVLCLGIYLASSALLRKDEINNQVDTATDDSSSTTCYGEPNSYIHCSGVYEPVCGCDGKLYSNKCTALAMGILITETAPDDLQCS
mmetsp:Transcript_26237/g.26483  ORF Transcript_26237/g.26483 Transcript_26237/m.26483 type:complete len:96 (+) Transcript_26237:213-500(+)